MTNEIVCFDVETTGLNPLTNHIIQLSMIRFNSKTFEVVVEKNWYVRPLIDTFEMEPSAEAVHGLSKEFIMENGVKLSEIYPEIIEILGDCDVLTYNGNAFDVGFLYNDLKEYGLFIDFNRKFYDAYTIECGRNSRRLVDVYKRYTGNDLENAHDALSDVKATIEVFKYQGLDNQDDFDKPEFNIISPEGWLMRMDDGTIVFTKGKYSRKPIADVCKIDPSYIKWVFENCSEMTKQTIKNEYYKDKNV